MPKQRTELRLLFRDGARPTGADFNDILESFIHRTEDGFGFGSTGTQVDNFTLGNFVAAPKEGSMRFAAGEVQFFNGTIWKGLNSPEFSFKKLNEQSPTPLSDIAYHGKVGINLGPAPASPLKDDLEIGPSDNISKARAGLAVIGGDSGGAARAMFFHTGVRQPDAAHNNGNIEMNYAFAQDADGRTYINTIGTNPLMFSADDSPKMRLQNGQLLIGGSSALTPLPNPPVLDPLRPILLHVMGHAIKQFGGISWLVTSDARMKKDISDFHDGLEKLITLRTVRFKYNGKGGTQEGPEQVGLIGQEVEKIFPYMVQKHLVASENDNAPHDEVLLLDSSPLLFIAINAIRELDEKIRHLENLKNKAHA